MSLSDHPTADEVFAVISKAYPNISRATVYRNLNQLADSGEILRVEVPNAPDRYDKTNFAHSHFLCKCCGRVYDCEAAVSFDASAEANVGLEMIGYHVIFYGRCKNCKDGHNN